MTESTPPDSSELRVGDMIGTLTALREPEGELAPPWNVEIVLAEGTKKSKAQRFLVPLERFLRDDQSINHRLEVGGGPTRIVRV